MKSQNDKGDPIKFPGRFPNDEGDQEPNQNATRVRSLVNYGLAILNFVAEKNRLDVTDDAKSVLAESISENSEEPSRFIFEMRQSDGTSRFGMGVEHVSELAAYLALHARRRQILASDILEAIRKSFCHYWPFCRRKP